MTTTATTDTDTGTATNADAVAAIYAAFAVGDVAAILDRLAPDVAFDADWPDNFAQRAGVAHLVPRRGRGEVAEFFALIGSWRVDAFEVRDVLSSGRQVVAQLSAAFTLPGGGRFADEELHLWTFDGDGRVVRFRHYVDTAKHIAASAGADTVDPA